MLGALASPGVRTLLVVSAAFGLAFGTLEVTMPAFARRARLGRDRRRAAGSARGGQHAGRRLVRLANSVLRAPLHADDPLLRVFAGALLPLAFAGSIPVMLVLMGLAGFFVAPWAATSASLVGRLAPAGAVTEAYTWEMTAVVAGFALGGVLSGVLVEERGRAGGADRGRRARASVVEPSAAWARRGYAAQA